MSVQGNEPSDVLSRNRNRLLQEDLARVPKRRRRMRSQKKETQEGAPQPRCDLPHSTRSTREPAPCREGPRNDDSQ